MTKSATDYLVPNSSIGVFLVASSVPFSLWTQVILLLSGALGAGLAIFTKWPIIGTSITPYSLNGEPTDVTGGDWYVGKAAASVTILHPTLGQVQIFVTHVGPHIPSRYQHVYRVLLVPRQRR